MTERDNEDSGSTTTSGESDARRSSVPPRMSGAPRRPSVGPNAPSPKPWSQLKHDGPSSVVVFLVALPLCLGIALASGAPLMAGLITGIVGGVVVSWASGSALGVSGPAAGLAVIVLHGIETLGYESFLLAVVLAGGIQIALGLLRAGIIGYYFPTTVIRGMLAGIGALLILKQLPHALGVDSDFMGDEAFWGTDHRNTFEEILYALGNVRWGAVIVAFTGLAILFGMDRIPAAKRPKLLPAPLIVVVLGIIACLVFDNFVPALAIAETHRVALPSGGPVALLESLSFPDFTSIASWDVWMTAATIAVVASLETLLSVEAVDKLDPYKRVTPTNRELQAQGLGNILAGLIGGLPMTAVIVRGSANVQAGGRTHMSAFLHGLLLLVAVLALPMVLNIIPLAALAAVLLHVGYKLAPISLFTKMYKLGWEFFIPFMATLIGIIATDLLKGVGLGMVVAIFFLLKRNFETPFVDQSKTLDAAGFHFVRMELSEHVSFLNKAAVMQQLAQIPDNSIVQIDGTRSHFIYRDVLEIIADFETSAKQRNISIELIDIPEIESMDAGH